MWEWVEAWGGVERTVLGKNTYVLALLEDKVQGGFSELDVVSRFKVLALLRKMDLSSRMSFLRRFWCHGAFSYSGRRFS